MDNFVSGNVVEEEGNDAVFFQKDQMDDFISITTEDIATSFATDFLTTIETPTVESSSAFDLSTGIRDVVTSMLSTYTYTTSDTTSHKAADDIISPASSTQEITTVIDGATVSPANHEEVIRTKYLSQSEVTGDMYIWFTIVGVLFILCIIMGGINAYILLVEQNIRRRRGKQGWGGNAIVSSRSTHTAFWTYMSDDHGSKRGQV